MNKELLRDIGAAMYVCEGTKARRDYRRDNVYICSIEFTNSDPKIINIFSRFLREIIQADWTRVRGQLFLYPDLNEEELKRYWNQVSEIPSSQFQKCIILNSKVAKFKTSPYGTFKIRYSCKKDFLKLQEIIESFWKNTGI